MTAFNPTLDYSKWLLMAIIGKPGVGKTTLVRWLIESGYKVAMFDTDGGAKSVEDLQDGGKSFLHAPCNTHDEFRAAWAECIALPADWVAVIDSFSTLLDNKASELMGDGSKLTMPQHGEIGSLGTRVLINLKNRSLKRHVIITCGEERIQNQEGRMFWAPMLHGKMTGKVFAHRFTGIFRLKMNKGERVLVTDATEESETKLQVPPALRASIPIEIPAHEFGRYFKLLAEGPEGESNG